MTKIFFYIFYTDGMSITDLHKLWILFEFQAQIDFCNNA